MKMKVLASISGEKDKHSYQEEPLSLLRLQTVGLRGG